MSRYTNKALYVPIGGGKKVGLYRKLSDKYRLPPLRKMLLSVAAASGFFTFVLLVLVITGLRLTSYSCDTGAVYHYFGWHRGGSMSAGLLCRSDGVTARVGGGAVRYSDGAVYTGQTSGFMKHGWGNLRLADGTVYSGGFSNDLYDGNGTLTFSDGETYTGGFSAGRYDGQGELRTSGGDVYTGGFSSGEKSGSGVMCYSCGDSFDGIFVSDMRTDGIYTWQSGESIEGEFTNNMPDPSKKLIYTSAAGRTYTAYFIGGKLSSKTAYTRPAPDAPDPDSPVG